MAVWVPPMQIIWCEYTEIDVNNNIRARYVANKIYSAISRFFWKPFAENLHFGPILGPKADALGPKEATTFT